MDAKVEFQNPDDALARSAPSPILKFERPDWALFRTVEGLSQKAGVPPHKLIRLVVKEICDNALDEAGKASVGKLPDGGGYFVEDGGRGMDPAEVSGLYSIKRSLVSTKLLRLPTRGALGNGLRVVAGAVQASSGTLTVITRNRRIELKPEYDGTTSVISATDVAFPVGTRVEISFGLALPDDHWTLQWAQLACRLAQGKVYAGRSSPWWYDPSSFHELFAAAGNRPVREVIAELDGCTGATAGVIVAAAKLNRTVCNTITREQATRLLEAARLHARPVTAERLGAIGPNAFLDCAYAMASGSAEFGSVAPLAEVPFVVEAWAQKAAGEAAEFGTDLTMCVNRTPITGVVDIARDKRDAVPAAGRRGDPPVHRRAERRGGVMNRQQRRLLERQLKDAWRRAGVKAPPQAQVDFLDRPWKKDDREWFERHSKRSHRARFPFPGEVEPQHADAPEGHRLLLLLRQIEPGKRIKLGFFINEQLLPVPDAEAVAHALFDVAAGREPIPPNGAARRALLAKYQTQDVM